MQFICKKCQCEEYVTKTVASSVGIYCNKCGQWQKWLNKDEKKLLTQNNTINDNSFVSYQRIRFTLSKLQEKNLITESQKFLLEEAFFT